MSFSLLFGSMWRELYLEVDVCIWSQKGYLSHGCGLSCEKVILQMLVFRVWMWRCTPQSTVSGLFEILVKKKNMILSPQTSRISLSPYQQALGLFNYEQLTSRFYQWFSNSPCHPESLTTKGTTRNQLLPLVVTKTCQQIRRKAFWCLTSHLWRWKPTRSALSSWVKWEEAVLKGHGHVHEFSPWLCLMRNLFCER